MDKATHDDQGKYQEKLHWYMKLPYQKLAPSFHSNNNLEYCVSIKKRLDEKIYGLDTVKEKIMHAVNDRNHNPNARSLIALKGKPGMGKTVLAKQIAEAAGLPFAKISLGGSIDSTMFKGSDGVWSGSNPSMLLQILARTGAANTVILLDEIDKLGDSAKGIEVENALLHILDPSQNTQFDDLYLADFPHDISKIWFIVSMNSDRTLSPALKDRLNIIDVPSYNKQELTEIIIRHVLPTALLEKGFDKTDITITKAACEKILMQLKDEIDSTGVRPIERVIGEIVSRLNMLRNFWGQDSKEIGVSYSLPTFQSIPFTLDTTGLETLYPFKSERQSTRLSYYT